MVLGRTRERQRVTCEAAPVSEWDDGDDGQAPICPWCGVTALPAALANVLDPGFVCDNADCDAYGEPVGDQGA